MNAVSHSTLPVSEILTDGGTQSRAQIYPTIVDDYAALIADGASFPPIVVFFDGSSYWLADGFHRHAAHVAAGCDDIATEVRQGARREAILYSVGANAKHGLRRTNDDKRRAVLTLLDDPEWQKWSDREIARRCGVSNVLVSKMRPEVTVNTNSDETRTYTNKHGSLSQMATAQIGQRRQPTGDPVQDGVNRAAEIHDQEMASLGADRPKPEPVMNLQGRDPREFNRALHFLGTFENYAREIERENVEAATAILTPAERDQLRNFIARIDAVHDRIVTRI